MAKVFFHLHKLNNFKGSKPVSLSQGTSPVTPGPPSLGEKGTGDGGRGNNNLTITLPHSNAQAMRKKLIVVQKYEPKSGDKGLAVKRGETVLLVRDDGEWLYVKNENGDEGYVPRSHLLSPSRTRTRTNSRSGTALRQVASNGSVPMHSTRLPDRTPDSPTVNCPMRTPLSQDDGHHSHRPHHQRNGHHPPTLGPNEILYDHDHKYQFSPGPDRGRGEEQAQSSSSSLSRDSYSSYDHCLEPTADQPTTLISPLNHIEGGREGLRREGGTDSSEDLPRSYSNSGRATVDSYSPSPGLTPMQVDGIHYIDKTTNHIYGTLEEPTSPPPPPLPPRNMPSATQDPEPNVYSQLEHSTAKTCSQEALVHPSHRHNSYAEGWARERKSSAHALRSGTSRSHSHKEVVEIRYPSSPRSKRGAMKFDRQQHHQDWRNQIKITKFRKTVWGVFVVTHDFDPLDENEIPIRKGEHVSVWNRDDRDWFWVVKHASSGLEEGFVPSGCLREVSAESKTSTARSGCHTPTNPTSGSPRLDDITADPMRHRAHSHESRHSNPAQQSRPPRPSSGGTSRSDSHRGRRSSEGNVHRVNRSHNRDPQSLEIKHDDPLPPSPPSSPPPPYTEYDTNSNRRFMSLSQQASEVHHSQPSGAYGHGMHRTRSQGYVTSRSRAVHYPNSPSSPHGGERRGEGRMFPDGGTLV